MDKRVTLKLNSGSLITGFPVILQIGNEGAPATVELSGSLPAAPHLHSLYQQWQAAYRSLGQTNRIEANPSGYVTNVSLIGDCDSLSTQLTHRFNQWLQATDFRAVQNKLLERLNPADRIRFILQTDQESVQRLPWHLWEMCDRYPNLEITLSAPAYETPTTIPPRQHDSVRILAVLGHSKGLDIETDKSLLNHLPNTSITFLQEPDRRTLNEHLWHPGGWDILFFAGHSLTQAASHSIQTRPYDATQAACHSGLTGKLYISPTDSITIEQLKNALRKAVARGLKIALFNSCDGLGLAHALADLHISQVLVMRELVPDPVAHAFLKSFIEAFSRGEPIYLAVREAREKLQAIEDMFPCAAWLPTLYQNPAEIPPTWPSLLQPSLPPPSTHPSELSLVGATSPAPRNLSSPDTPKPSYALPAQSLPRRLLVLTFTTALLLLLRQIGFFQRWELQSFDRLLRLRPAEMPDPRLVIITIDETDIQAQNPEDRRGSLSDSALLQVIAQLQESQPRTIGLDIYRDFPAKTDQPDLAAALSNQENLLAVCKSSDIDADSEGIQPPPEVPNHRVGFSDFVKDSDSQVRRQLLTLTPELSSPCVAEYGLATLLALNYLSQEDVPIGISPEGELQIGELTIQPIGPRAGSYSGIDAGGRQILLNYRNLPAPEQIANRITLTEFLQDDISAEALRDRIILIGTIANSSGDSWLTPYGETNGVFLQAHMTSQLISAVLNDRPLLRGFPEWGDILWVAAWAAVGSALLGILRKQQSHALPKLAFSLLVSELALFALCWLLLSKAQLWVPWSSAAIAPIAVVATSLLTHRTSNRFSTHRFPNRINLPS
ncbi:MAG: CHASE2 domain-containing protein [Cyanobacteria bacterium J06614_10]